MQGPSRAQMERPCRAHPGPRWSAHAGSIQGLGEKPPDPDPDELSDPNQVPSHRAQGENTSLRGPSLQSLQIQRTNMRPQRRIDRLRLMENPSRDQDGAPWQGIQGPDGAPYRAHSGPWGGRQTRTRTNSRIPTRAPPIAPREKIRRSEDPRCDEILKNKG